MLSQGRQDWSPSGLADERRCATPHPVRQRRKALGGGWVVWSVCSLLASTGCTPSATGPDANPPIDLQSTRLAATAQESCLLRTTGAVVCWGRGDAPRTISNSGELAFVALDGGWDHLCGLTAEGLPFCWGRNEWGQVGDGTQVVRSEPTPVATSRRLVAITASVFSTCGLDTDGLAHCWGRNEFGAVGNGLSGPGQLTTVPRAVAGSPRFLAIDGAWANCGISADGLTLCWGGTPGSFGGTQYVAPGDCADVFYEMFEGAPCDVPTPVGGDVTFDRVAGDRCAVTGQSRAFCWGDGSLGALGDGNEDGHSINPVAVEGGILFTSLAVGASHACGLDLAGLAYCWGNNFAGQLGISENGQSGGTALVPTPSRVDSAERFVELVAGSAHTCGLTASESVWCWGSNDSQQLGPQVEGVLSDVPVRVNLPALGG